MKQVNLPLALRHTHSEGYCKGSLWQGSTSTIRRDAELHAASRLDRCRGARWKRFRLLSSGYPELPRMNGLKDFETFIF